MTQPMTWDDMVATYRRLTETLETGERWIRIIGTAVYEDLYRRTPIEDRPRLAAMREHGELIVSPNLPDGVVGYRYTHGLMDDA